MADANSIRIIFDFRVLNVLAVDYELYQSGNPMMNRLTAFDGRANRAILTCKF